MTIRPDLYLSDRTQTIHCVGVGATGSDRTLCSVPIESDYETLRRVPGVWIDCERCLEVIEFCRGLSKSVLP